MAVMLLEWVFTSAFLILVVLALRAALGKRVSARLRYALWAVVLMRLLVPVQLFTSPIAGTWTLIESRAEQNVIDWPSTPTAPANASIDNAVSLGGQGSISTGLTTFPSAPEAPVPPTVPDAPEAPDLNNLPGWVSYLGWAWLAGSAVVALVFLLSNLRFYWQLRRERIPLDDVDHPLRVYVAVGLPSPCLFGLIRPAIYVTPEAAASPDMLRHVLAHEYTHYRHGDHIWSFLRCTVLAIHWWNPLVWVSAVLSQRDGELACDEGALKRLGDGERAAYGGTLLALVTAKPRPGDLFRCATTMAGDKKSLKERISRIAKAPKRVIWAVVVVVLVTALACVCAFGQAEEPEEENGPDSTLQESETLNLSFFLNDHGLVEIMGTVDGLTLQPGTYWQPTGAPANTLTMPYAPFDDDGVDGMLYAWWENDHTVVLNTIDMPPDDDSSQAGFWSFCVDLSQESGVVTEMVSMPSLPAQAEGTELRLYPESISDEEAVKAARIAAKLMTAAEKFYLNSSNQEPGSDYVWNMGYFVPDVTDVPEEVVYFVRQAVTEKYNAYETLVNTDENIKDLGIEFDDFRIKTLEGPWTGTACDMNLETWRINYEFHTTTPKEAENLLVGGNDLTEDGWLRPTYPNSNYVVFLLSDAGTRGFLMSTMINDCGPESRMFWEQVGDELTRKGLMDPNGLADVDLNRNSVPETIMTSIGGAWEGQRVEVWEDDELIYSEEASASHVGWNAVFLYRDGDGQDYLLRYNPYMNQGAAGYSYRLFTLSKTGEKQVVRENSVDFDINFHPLFQYHSFDPEAIVSFMDEINGLLANSVQLINTDDNLLSAFEKEGRLYDSLCWLDHWEPVFTRDENKSLLENLKDFQAAMKAEHYAEEPTLFVMNETEENAHVWLTYQDRNTQFDAEWEWGFQPEDSVDVQVLDWNNDGKDEIVFSLIWGHGTGACIEKLYVFDADTLEQYDTSSLNEMILNAIQSTGDEDNFYLSGAGLDVTISKSEAQEMNEYIPVADDICFENTIRYTIKDGKVFCGLGCDASGVLLNYIGYVNVPVQMTSSGNFVCGQAQYIDDSFMSSLYN